MNLILLVLAGIFVNNYVMSQFLGICPFLGVSKKVDTAAGMGMAVIFVMALAAAAAWLVYALILVPLNITYLYNIAFILLIASLVQFVEMFLKKAAPALYQALGVFLPLITTNCAVLGVAVTNMQKGYNFIESVLNAVGGAAGFALAICLFAGIRERIADNDTPKAFDGFPMALITAGLMSIAFLGFSGLIKL
ncbi:electron transport complex subunit RsxA [Anaerotignum sp.]|nr:electron transport complex subunit RsxA [Anaerotignum sp.]MBQ7758754.1 electron transport complex subunit RsxA [Anaerotignum sp.]